MLFLSLLTSALVSAQRCSTGPNVTMVALAGDVYWSMNITGHWTSSNGFEVGKALHRDQWSVYLKDYRIDIWLKSIFKRSDGTKFATIIDCASKDIDAAKFGKCSTGYNVKDVSFTDDKWIRNRNDDWLSAVKGVNMGLPIRRDPWSIYFKKHQIDLWTGKLYSLGPKAIIANITSCSSSISKYGSFCSTGYNVNSVKISTGKIAKDCSGNWITPKGRNLGKEIRRDMWSVYFPDRQIDLHLKKFKGPGVSRDIYGCSN